MAKSSDRDGRVKTWKVLRDGTKMGNSVRDFGDFLPEAPGLETFRSLLRADLIEEVWVDQEEFDEWEQDQKERDEARLNPASVVEEDDDDEEDDENSEPEDDAPAPRKKVAKKTVVKKPKKKGKTSAKLTEQSV